CESSFIAAQTKIAKVSSKHFVDTGIMGLLCWHDSVLWVVNLMSAGEKQFYAFALLECMLFTANKSDLLISFMSQWGFLEDVFPRLQFTVSVFHAYGHQWACQLLFHPHKAIGFGLTDGE
ncbi:hypothetical protein M422DRAFT_79416, partial [Sphaerobolus stellatus SS14]